MKSMLAVYLRIRSDLEGLTSPIVNGLTFIIAFLTSIKVVAEGKSATISMGGQYSVFTSTYNK